MCIWLFFINYILAICQSLDMEVNAGSWNPGPVRLHESPVIYFSTIQFSLRACSSFLIILFIVENHLCIYTNVFSKLFAWTRCSLTGIYLILNIPFMRHQITLMCSCRNELYKFSNFLSLTCILAVWFRPFCLNFGFSFFTEGAEGVQKKRKCSWWTEI